MTQNIDVTDISKWTVLIVDDEPDNLSVPQQLLTHLGAQVYTAQDGAEGMVVLGKVIPTLILLDLSMPVMDGWEMLKAVRQQPMCADTVVIALTAHAMAGDKERVLDAGFDSYISKPFMFDTFLDEIRNCLRDIVAQRQNNTV